MSRHDDRFRVAHMLEHAREAVALLGDHSLEQLREERLLELALLRLVEVIGEAASQVSRETQQCIDAIPWSQVIGMRHKLIHATKP